MFNKFCRSSFLLFCIFFFFLPNHITNNQINDDPHSLSTLNGINERYSDNLYILTNDGKIFSYQISKREISWMIDLELKFINFTNSDSRKKIPKFEDNTYLFPTLDGNFIFYSKFDGIFKLDRNEIDDITNECFVKKNEKIFTYFKEKLFLIDKTSGKFVEFDENFGVKHKIPDQNGFDETSELIILKIRQKIIKNIDLVLMKEKWNIVSSETNFYFFDDYSFFNSKEVKINEEKENPYIKIIKTTDKNLNILRNSDNKLIFSLETEEDILLVYSIDSNGMFYKNNLIMTFHFLEQDIIKNFISKDDSKEIKVYNYYENENSTSLAIYKSHHDDDLCIYSNKCLAPSLTHWSKLNNENLESEIVKCMIEVRKRKKLEFQNIEKNETHKTLSETIKPSNNISFNFEIDLNQIIYLILCIILALCLRIYKKNYFINKIVIDNNTQVSAHITESPETSLEPIIKPDSKENINNNNNSNNNKSIIIFEKNNVLGYGANGTTVFNGFFQGREAAIKRILKQNSQTGKIEIDILIKLDHPNIIKFFYFEEKEDFMYLALEKCECSIADVIDFISENKKFKKNKEKICKSKFIFNFLGKKKNISKNISKDIMIKCVKGLTYLHSQNIAHRDLKPENILISKTNIVKLADFSLSKELPISKKFNTNEIGTIGWRAKEVINSEEKNLSADIFSLGCIFYYIYNSGIHPFGEIKEREINIVNNNWNQKLIENDVLFLNLIKILIHSIPNMRYESSQILNHPFFWSDEEKLIYICDFSDFLEANENTYSQKLEEWSLQEKILSKSWALLIDNCLFKDLISFRKYNHNSLKDLIRVIRNKKNHFYNLPFQIKSIFNETLGGIFVYFDERFPKLFSSLFDFVNFNKIDLLQIRSRNNI